MSYYMLLPWNILILHVRMYVLMIQLEANKQVKIGRIKNGPAVINLMKTIYSCIRLSIGRSYVGDNNGNGI